MLVHIAGIIPDHRQVSRWCGLWHASVRGEQHSVLVWRGGITVTVREMGAIGHKCGAAMIAPGNLQVLHRRASNIRAAMESVIGVGQGVSRDRRLSPRTTAGTVREIQILTATLA